MIKLLFLADSYLPTNHGYGSYLESILTYLRSLDCNILVIRTNTFLSSTFTDHVRYFDDYKHMLDEIKSFNPDLVFSINRNGMTEEVLQNCLRKNIPIINWIVDPIDQIEKSVKKLSKRDIVTLFTSGIGHGVNSKENVLVDLKISPKQLLAFPFFVDTFHFFSDDQPKTVDLSFVASAYPQSLLNHFISIFIQSVYSLNLKDADQIIHKNLNIIANTYRKHQTNYIDNLRAELENSGFDFDLLEHTKPDIWLVSKQPYKVQAYFDAHITSQKRSNHLGAVVGLKLDLYGVPDYAWVDQLCSVNIDLIRSFNFRPVIIYAELSSIYNRSKLSLNIQNHSSCGTGFSFRVFDVVACKTLLLTEASSVAPLAHLGFTEGVHYISFDSPADLRSKADYYLAHDDERSKITDSAYRLLESFLKDCSLQSILGKNLEEVGFRNLGGNIRKLTKKDFLYTLNKPNSDHLRTIGWR